MFQFVRIILAISFLALHNSLSAQDRRPENESISLPTSKTLMIPSPGRIASTNSFPATIALSPDGRYAALLNNGYGARRDAGRAIDWHTRSQNESAHRLS